MVAQSSMGGAVYEVDKDYSLTYVVELLVRAHADYFRPAALDLSTAIKVYAERGRRVGWEIAAEADEVILFFIQHMDEEDAHYFPVIRRAVSVRTYLPDERGILRRYVEAMGKLNAAHIETEPHIAAMHSWIDRLAGAEADDLIKMIRAYVAMVEAHMIIEETVLLPRARELVEAKGAD